MRTKKNLENIQSLYAALNEDLRDWINEAPLPEETKQVCNYRRRDANMLITKLLMQLIEFINAYNKITK